ncbi:MAG: hypothetical protein J5856_03715 [Lachnospiraceae bacterium]|nr:hypothetical protein [Lachnospiraceae bacterium]
MKFCPHCKINIGGNLEKCPLCQNLLTGTGEEDYCPKIEIKTRKRHKAFKIVTFCVLAVIIINLALDYLFIDAVHPSWSPLVLGWLLVSGWLLEFILRKHYNLLKTLFLSMIAVSILCQFTESYMYLAWSAWNIPYLGITSGYIIPILCSANMVANFVLSMIDKHFTDHSMIYMFLNILVGVVPWLALLFFFNGKPPLTWSICLVINILAFVGLVIFRGRTVLSEFKKRFHM